MKVNCVTIGKIINSYDSSERAARQEACRSIEELLAKGHDIISVSESVIESAGMTHMSVAIYYRDNG